MDPLDVCGDFVNLLLGHVPFGMQSIALEDARDRLGSRETVALDSILARVLQDQPAGEAINRLDASILSRIGCGQTSEAVSVCLRSNTLRTRLLDHVCRRLQDYLQLVVGTGVLPLDADEAHMYMSNVKTSDPVSPVNLEDSSVQLNLLSFLSLLLSEASPGTLSIPQPLAKYLMLLVFIDDPAMARATRSTLVALMLFYTKAREGDPGLEQIQHIDSLLWPCIQRLLSVQITKSRCVTAFHLWLRWLHCDPESSLREAMHDVKYWLLIQQGLAQGDVEQSKLCLQILRLSVELVASDTSDLEIVQTHLMPLSEHREDMQTKLCTEYARFCMLYETVILGRYLNQISACLPDLNRLASFSSSLIPHSWLYCLLSPALALTTTDGIRKLIGEWFLKNKSGRVNTSEVSMFFLKERFLPWVTQPSLFLKSLTGQMPNVVCRHGEALREFIENALFYSSFPSAKLGIARTVIAFIYDHIRTIMPFAIIYLLSGLLNRLPTGPALQFDDASIARLHSISNGPGWPELARDRILLLCQRLLQSLTSTTDRARQRRLEALDLRVDELLAIEKPADYVKADDALQNLYERLAMTNSACLRNDGLLLAVSTIKSVLDAEGHLGIDGAALLRVLRAVRYEMEIQEFPRKSSMLMPEIVLHPACIQSIRHVEGSTQLLADVVEQYTALTRGRIYLWPPLMIAVRRAFRFDPVIMQAAMEDLIYTIASDPPTARLDNKMEATVSSVLKEGAQQLDYAHYYGHDEGVGYAAFFDIVSCLEQSLGKSDVEIVDRLFDRMLNIWVTPSGALDRDRTTEQLQVMVLLVEQFSLQIPINTAQSIVADLLKAIEREVWPRYRFLLEWMVLRLAVRHLKICKDLLESLSTTDPDSSPKLVVSAIKMSTMIACLADTEATYSEELVVSLMTLSLSSKVTIRHEAAWSLPIVWDHATARGFHGILSNRAIARVVMDIKRLDKYQEPLPHREYERFDPSRDITMANLLSGRYILLSPSATRILNQTSFDVLYDHVDKGPTPCLRRGKQKLFELPQALVDREASELDDTPSVALQTKGSAYLSMDKLFTTDSPQTSDAGIIVVGSLIENNTNLGGLSRVSEIFGASALYMANPTTTIKTHAFLATSVSSHLNIAIHDLAARDVSEFLGAKKKQGYTVVGIEQTDRSLMLGAEGTLLPKCTVLVLGAEKEGIPALLLGECDWLVEIPQSGTTRSLNVQTAAGCVLYEYGRQHRTQK